MSWKQYASSEGSIKDNPLLVAAGIFAIVLVVIGGLVFINVTRDDEAIVARRAQAAEAAATTIPVIVVDPENAQSAEPFFPPEPTPEELGPNHGAHQDEHIDHGDTGVDYGVTPIPPDQFAVVFPPAESNLTPAEFEAAKAMGAAVVTATRTGTGREKFPSLFPGNVGPTPTMKTMVIDHTYAQFVPNYPKLVRSVVIYHGTNTANITFSQVRIAQYLERQADGTLQPVQRDNLPYNLARQDGLLQGVSIIA